MKIYSLQTAYFVILSVLLTLNEASFLKDFYLRLFKNFNKSSSKKQSDATIQDQISRKGDLINSDDFLTRTTNRPTDLSRHISANEEWNSLTPIPVPESNREGKNTGAEAVNAEFGLHQGLPTVSLDTDENIVLDSQSSEEESASSESVSSESVSTESASSNSSSSSEPASTESASSQSVSVDADMMPVGVVPVSIQQTVVRPIFQQNLNRNTPTKAAPTQNVNVNPAVDRAVQNTRTGNMVQVANNKAVYLSHSKHRDAVQQDNRDIVVPVLKISKADENSPSNLETTPLIKTLTSTSDPTDEFLLMSDDSLMFDNDEITETANIISAEFEHNLEDILSNESDEKNNLDAAILAKGDHPLQDLMSIWLESKIVEVQRGKVKV